MSVYSIVNACNALQRRGFTVKEIEQITRDTLLWGYLEKSRYCSAIKAEELGEMTAHLIEQTGYSQQEVERAVCRLHLEYHIRTITIEQFSFEDVNIALNYWKGGLTNDA